ncbi:calcium transporter ChaC [Burkholderia multivorans]|uniref:gamma-glutamylcyclotransferase n=1 Tax=Burkholderia multivorans TaxID=87883 RepID=UPI00018E370F|nr:gamma-glutamylcyclotransferase [Burkholderia multivorans]AOJ94912.1 calcium transporter ChaC [Burkholderia multivorans]EED96941.1 cation transport protein ChaC [Burkholderia multivorans CGD1]MDR8751500.1 Glutathione-specific gamma-glutamylcyclotransferase [Burkholderia multivorans]MDR8810547.1 Glutathione-specific gamma-glutamylcyclotransferase [Burkholderia multivorans]
MLSKQAIDSGAYIEHFRSMPGLWSTEQIEQSLVDTLSSRPDDELGVWVFAYGSLMWNPMVTFDRRVVATLHDWHRSFCLEMVIGRGSADLPGRMLALEAGGQTNGVALRLSGETMHEDLKVLWIREMVLGSYRPTWARVTLDDGAQSHAIVFVANEMSVQYQADSCVAKIAPLIATATGAIGSNAEYVFRLRDALSHCELADEYVEALANEIERYLAGEPCGQADAPDTPSSDWQRS